MKRLLGTVLLLYASLATVGCKGDDTNYPISPGGGGPGGGKFVDAAVSSDGDDGSNLLAGRVCLIADPRTPAACASTGADGLTVTLGTEMATTMADGTFSIVKPAATGLVWRVSGTAIEPTAMRTGTSLTIPVLSDTVYGDMVASMNAVVTGETGAIIAQVMHGGTAVSGAVATATPGPDSTVYYDGTSSTDWTVDATHGFGIVWISAIAAGTASLALDNGTVQGTITAIPVFAGAVTFERAEIP